MNLANRAGPVVRNLALLKGQERDLGDGMAHICSLFPTGCLVLRDGWLRWTFSEQVWSRYASRYRGDENRGADVTMNEWRTRRNCFCSASTGP